MKLPRLILASGSPRRKELLSQLAADFEVVCGGVSEVESGDLTPREACQLNAYRKARAVAREHPDALVLGADTVVSLDHRIFGKPRDWAEAVRTLSELQGRTHRVITGVCLMVWEEGKARLFAESTAVKFRLLSTADLEDYLSRIHPLDKAGAYAIQEHGELIVEEIHGSFTNVVGLPLERLKEELEQWGAEQ